ncbi:MAG: LytTR family DNA-binding domain-containing protein [Prolixibacteraceae bacterium]|nr:LytTR family DNA-binding domain-containing protein [Prolixibacteraceae bacterium]
MKVLIVEDEPLAATQLTMLISEVKPAAEIMGICDTVESTIKWLEENPTPDLAFFDIQLGDDLSFEIFNRRQLTVPVIFTTAYNEYALQAFKTNSIDYLLKPIDKTELRTAIEKFEKYHLTKQIPPALINAIRDSIEAKEYKKRFLVKIGTHLKIIITNDIIYFYSFQKGTFLKLNDGRNYLVEQTLENLENLLDPEKFFRINRKYIVALNAITDVVAYSNSRLKLKVKNQEEDDFLVAREKVKTFKEWLEGNK